MKKPAQPVPAGYLASLRSLGDGLLATVQERAELFSIELQEEKFRLVQTFMWSSAIFYTGMLTITFASLTLVFMFWDTARLAVLGGLAVFYLLLLLAMILAFRRFLARQPLPFAGTQLELQEDRACIRNDN